MLIYHFYIPVWAAAWFIWIIWFGGAWDIWFGGAWGIWIACQDVCDGLCVAWGAWNDGIVGFAAGGLIPYVGEKEPVFSKYTSIVGNILQTLHKKI